MRKKSQSTNWQRAVAVVAPWIVRLHRLVIGVAVVLLVSLLVAAWFNPAPPAQPRRELAGLQAEHTRQESRLLALAKLAPPTGRINLNFDRLDFSLPPGVQPSLANGNGYGAYLPAGIKSYDGREVRIQGFMLPTKLERGLVTECLVLANQMSCCFGQAPRFCGFIAVHIEGPGVPDQMDQPLRFEGRLRVGDVFADGAWVALYSMNCTAVNP
jgi:hypothetical protein